MSRFLTSLELREIIPDEEWELLSPLRYESDLFNGIITVPEHFPTDLASIPRLPFIYWTLGGTANAPACIHDFLYCWQNTTRELADKILYEAMGVIGLPAWRKDLIYAGVRIGGWTGWGHDTETGKNWRNYVMPK